MVKKLILCGVISVLVAGALMGFSAHKQSPPAFIGPVWMYEFDGRYITAAQWEAEMEQAEREADEAEAAQE